MWYCNKQLRTLTLRGLLLSLLKSCPAAVWTNEQIQLGCCRTGDHVEQWEPIPAEPGSSGWPMELWTEYIIDPGMLGSLGSWCWDGVRNGKYLWKEKGRKPGVAGGGDRGGAIRASCPWQVSIKGPHCKRCLLAKSWTGPKWLDFYTTALFWHQVGATLRGEPPVWRLPANSTSSCQAVSRPLKNNLSGTSLVLIQQALGSFVMQQKLTESYNCKGGWEI